jgi:hypothetical protein
MRAKPNLSAVRSYGDSGLSLSEQEQQTGLGPVVVTELASDTRRLTARIRPTRERVLPLPNVLSIGLSEGQEIAGVAHVAVRQPREVIEMLRVLHFNLLLVGPGAMNSATWNLLDLVHRHWPDLRWVLVPGENCGDREEILARSLGATSVSTDLRVIAELAGSGAASPEPSLPE